MIRQLLSIIKELLFSDSQIDNIYKDTDEWMDVECEREFEASYFNPLEHEQTK